MVLLKTAKVYVYTMPTDMINLVKKCNSKGEWHRKTN